MAITKEMIKDIINDMRAQGKPDSEIEEMFKNALTQRTISLDMYFVAVEEIQKK